MPGNRLPLFFFGTLCDHDVLELVVDHDVDRNALTPAVLPDHVVVRYPDSSYAMLVESPGSRAHGRLLREYSEEDFARIQFFDSDEFAVRQCRVIEPDGGITPALVFSEAKGVSVTMDPWRLADWQRTEKADFLPLAREFMAWFGYGTIEDAEALWEYAENRLFEARVRRRDTSR